MLLRGRVVSVRPLLRRYADSGEQYMERMLCDVEIQTQAGRTATLVDCTTGVPLQVGHRVMVAQIYGDSQFGGHVMSLESPAKAQRVALASPAYDSEGGLNITRTNLDYLAANPNNPEGSDNPTALLVNRLARRPDVLFHRSRQLTDTFRYLLPPPSTFAVVFDHNIDGLWTPVDEIPAQRWRPQAMSEQQVTVTADELQFETINSFGEITGALVYSTLDSTRITPVTDTTPVDERGHGGSNEFTRNGWLVNAVQIYVRVWLTLEFDDGTEILGQSEPPQYALSLQPIIDIASTETSVGASDRTAVNARNTVVTARAFSQAFLTAFDGLGPYVGQRATVRYYTQMAIVDKLPAQALEAALALRGRWLLSMRELNQGSAL